MVVFDAARCFEGGLALLMARQTFAGAVQVVAQHKKPSPVIWVGPPARPKAMPETMLPATQAKAYLEFYVAAQKILKELCLQAGFGYADFFALTRQRDNTAAEGWLCDPFHALPRALGEALAGHYTPPRRDLTVSAAT